MGDGTPPDGGGGTGGGTGGGGGSGTDVTALLTFFQQLYSQLRTGFDLITVGTTQVALYANSKKVKRAIIQNQSTTDVVTVFAQSGNVGKVATIAAGGGILLNPAPTNISGQGGGSIQIGNGLSLIELGGFTVITNINNNQTIGVYYEY